MRIEDYVFCDECRHWFEPKHGTQGECRVNPPEPLLDEDGFVRGVFPSIGADGWCGKAERVNHEQSA
jgi:hypothetical protein